MTTRHKALVILLAVCLSGWPGGRLLAQQGDGVAPTATGKISPLPILYLYVMQAAAMPNVQDELKLTDGQLATMAEIKRTLRQMGRDTEAREKALTAAKEKINSDLSAEQRTRLHQIHLQSLLLRAFLTPDVIETLKLTQEQQSELQVLDTNFRKDRRARAADTPAEDRLSAGRRRSREAMATALAILTPSQREKFEELRGPEFDFSRRVPPTPGYDGPPPERKTENSHTEAPKQ